MECQQSDFCTAFTYDEDNKCVLHHLLCKPNEYPSTSFVKMDLGVCKGETMNYLYFLSLGEALARAQDKMYVCNETLQASLGFFGQL